MSQLSANELRDVMRACMGRDEAAVLDAAVLDEEGLLATTFEELDFDSLAQVELAARLVDHYGITISDGELDQLRGPRDVLDYVNARIAS